MPLFFVASRGLTASTWLCHALSSHPQIFCSHGRDKPARGLKVKSSITDKEYRDDRLRYEQWQREAALNEYIDELKLSSSGEKVLGNIHGYILPELIDKLKESQLYGKVPIANMTRDPIGFIESYTCLVQQNVIEYPEKYQKEHVPRMKDNIHWLQTYSDHVETDYEMQGFVEACVMLNKMIADFEYEDVPLILMEKITSEKEYFQETISHLTNGTIRFHQSDLEKIFNAGRINSHREKIDAGVKRPAMKNTPKDIWMQWSVNKKNAFLEIVGKSRLKTHILLGYDLSYL